MPTEFTSSQSWRIRGALWSLLYFASAWSSGEKRLAFKSLPQKLECSFTFCLGLWLVLNCIRHGSLVSDGGWNDQNCLYGYSWPVDKLTVSCLYKTKYWYWQSKHCNELWSDWGLPISALCFRSWTHAYMGWDGLLVNRGRAGLQHWLEFFHPGKLTNDVCLV